jgi:hypothetical protein
MANTELNKEKLIKYWIDSSDDDFKMSFKKQCTIEFTSMWIDKIKNTCIWIKALISK